MSITPTSKSLPAVLARDALRSRLAAYLLWAAALTVLAGVIGGLFTASDLIGWE